MVPRWSIPLEAILQSHTAIALGHGDFHPCTWSGGTVQPAQPLTGYVILQSARWPAARRKAIYFDWGTGPSTATFSSLKSFFPVRSMA